MNAQACLQMLRTIKDVSFASVDKEGMPHNRMIDVMLIEDKKLYFCTARGKDFYDQITQNPHIAITGLNTDFQMIRLHGKVKQLNNPKVWIDRIFEANPVMNDVYPGDSRYILEPFVVDNGQIEFFDLGKHPIDRQSFRLDQEVVQQHGFLISDAVLVVGHACEIVRNNAFNRELPISLNKITVCIVVCAMKIVQYMPSIVEVDHDFLIDQSMGFLFRIIDGTH